MMYGDGRIDPPPDAGNLTQIAARSPKYGERPRRLFYIHDTIFLLLVRRGFGSGTTLAMRLRVKKVTLFGA
jgi:hypothetical protein